MKVVSLAPTQTEIIAWLGAAESLRGISENCDYPPSVKNLPAFGSWAYPDLPEVLRAAPDLVCTFGKHQEEIAAWLEKRGVRVFHSDPPTVADSLKAMDELAEHLSCSAENRHRLMELEERVANVVRTTRRIPERERLRVLRIMHWDPLITVGPGAFQHDVISLAGGRALPSRDPQGPYFKVSEETVLEWDPEVIFFCEPFIEEVLRAHPRWRRCTAVRKERIHVFDCGLTCRAGPRIVEMLEILFGVLRDAKSDREPEL